VSFEVRTADVGDAAALATLEQAAREHLEDQRGGPPVLAEQPAVEDWAALVGREDVRVLIATIDGVPLGYLELHLPDPTGRAVVRQVYVDAGARELGFGDDMIGIAIEETRRAGGTVIESFALPGDPDTKNQFESAGITARKINV
jgi:hypothetical protein